MTRQYTALMGDVFAGLFTAGVKQSGFKVLGTLEHTNYGAKTAHLNHPEVTQHLKVTDWGESGPASQYIGKVDFMATNPPCALWSSARVKAIKTNYLGDPRLGWIHDLTDAGLLIQPKAWCWESVTNAWRNGRGFVIEIAQRWAQEGGYSTTVLLQNNKYLGVPQNRPRMFLIAHKHPLVFPDLVTPLTVRQALKGVKIARGEKVMLNDGYRTLWELCGEQGANDLFKAYQQADPELQAKFGRGREYGGKPSFLSSRLRADQPSTVFLGGLEKQLHPTEPRFLAYGECLRIAGAPDDWQSAVPLQAATGELSRAVMPPVGRWLGHAVATGLARPKLKNPVYQLVDLSKGPEHAHTEDLW